MKHLLEVIGFTIESCITAQAAGAHRIELCDNPGEGGTTASAGFISLARKKLSIELYPIIRPRGGDFLYNDDEFQIMKKDILVCKKAGCDGIVAGMLLADGRIDKIRCEALVALAYPLGVTFHRAFDRTNDARQALEDIVEIGCERILTSGLHSTAEEGALLIRELIAQAAGRIIIMPGSGIRSGNIAKIAKETGAEEFHSSARINIKSRMLFASETMKENAGSVSADAGEIEAMRKVLNEFTG